MENKDNDREATVVRDRVSLYSAVPDVKALGKDGYGSFFVYSIVEVFPKYAHILDVKELAKKVNNFKKNDMKGSTANLDSNITKKFYLNPTNQCRKWSHYPQLIPVYFLYNMKDLVQSW